MVIQVLVIRDVEVRCPGTRVSFGVPTPEARAPSSMTSETSKFGPCQYRQKPSAPCLVALVTDALKLKLCPIRAVRASRLSIQVGFRTSTRFEFEKVILR